MAESLCSSSCAARPDREVKTGVSSDHNSHIHWDLYPGATTSTPSIVVPLPVNAPQYPDCAKRFSFLRSKRVPLFVNERMGDKDLIADSSPRTVSRTD